MKKLLKIFGMVALLSTLNSQLSTVRAIDLTFNLGSVIQGASTNRNILVVPVNLNPPPPLIANYAAILTNSDGGGNFTITNLYMGFYEVTVEPPGRLSFFKFEITTNVGGADTGNKYITASANSTWPMQSTAWSASASDARYAPISSAGVASNAVQLTVTNTIQGVTNIGASTGTFQWAGDTNIGGKIFSLVWDPSGFTLGNGTSGNFRVAVTGVSGLVGVLSANQFFGDGSGLTNLAPTTNASLLTAGTLPDARLSTNVPLQTANNFYSGVNTHTNTTTILETNSSGQTVRILPDASMVGTGKNYHLGSSQTNAGNTDTIGIGPGQTMGTNTGVVMMGPTNIATNNVGVAILGAGLTVVNKTNEAVFGVPAAFIEATNNKLNVTGALNASGSQANLTNTGNNLTGSNVTFWSSLVGWGSLYWNGPNGGFASTDDPLFRIANATNHGGGQNNSEWECTFNQLFIGVVDHAQFGSPASPTTNQTAWVMNYQGAIPGNYNKSAAVGFRNSVPTNTGANVWHQWSDTYGDTNHTQLHITKPIFGGNQTWTQTGSDAMVLDQEGGVQIPGYTALGFAVNNATGTNYGIDLTNKETVSVTLSANLNLYETNLQLYANITNAISIHKRIELYPELNNWTLTVQTNNPWLLGFDYGAATNAWPATITNSQMMRIDFDYEISSTVTNRYAKISYFPYSPVTDTNAAQFFTATGITDPTTKAAVNQRILNAKAHGYWANAKDFHPVVGGTTNTMAVNAVNTNKYRWNYSGGYITNTTGITGNGTTAVIDSGFNPSTEITSASNVFCGIYVRGPATPTASGWFFGCNDAVSGGRRWGFRVNSGQANFESGGMNNNTIGESTITASGSFVGYCAQNRVNATQEYDIVKGNAVVLNASATTTNGLPALDVFILARQDTAAGGFPASADAWVNAEVNDFWIIINMTTQNMTDFLADEAAFKTALGR